MYEKQFLKNDYSSGFASNPAIHGTDALL